MNKIDGWIGLGGGWLQRLEESSEASQDMILMSYWRILANSTWQPLQGAHKSSFKSHSLFFYMELVKKLQGQFCPSRKSTAGIGTIWYRKSTRSREIKPPPPPQNISGDIYYTGDKPRVKRGAGPVLPAVITLLRKPSRSTLCYMSVMYG